MFDKLKWTKDANCQVCERRMPEGYHGYIGTGPGTHVVIVTWAFEGTRGADGALTLMRQGVVRRLTPAEALEAAEVAIKAANDGPAHDHGKEGEAC